MTIKKGNRPEITNQPLKALKVEPGHFRDVHYASDLYTHNCLKSAKYLLKFATLNMNWLIHKLPLSSLVGLLIARLFKWDSSQLTHINLNM